MMEDNQLIQEIKARYSRDYIKMVNDQWVLSGKNEWDFVFRSFAMQKMAEFELRLSKLESNQQTEPAQVTRNTDENFD